MTSPLGVGTLSRRDVRATYAAHGRAAATEVNVNMDVIETPRAYDAHRIRAIAVEAHCDPRSVRRVLSGVTMRSSLAERIERAVTELRAAGRLPSGERGQS